MHGSEMQRFMEAAGPFVVEVGHFKNPKDGFSTDVVSCVVSVLATSAFQTIITAGGGF